MRLTKSDLRLLQEGLDHVCSDAEFELEINSDHEQICRAARISIQQAEKIYDKLSIIIETLTNLHYRDVQADVLLAPGVKQ